MKRALLGLAAAALVFTAACGDDDDDRNPTETTQVTIGTTVDPGVTTTTP